VLRKRTKRRHSTPLGRRARRHRARAKARAGLSAGARVHLRRASSYPIEGCWIQEGWEEDGPAHVVVARSQPDGDLVYAYFYIDCRGAGIEDTSVHGNVSDDTFHGEHLPDLLGTEPQEISPALAHEMVYGAISLAENLGSSPHREYAHSRYLLDPPDAYPPSGRVSFGRDN